MDDGNRFDKWVTFVFDKLFLHTNNAILIAEKIKDGKETVQLEHPVVVDKKRIESVQTKLMNNFSTPESGIVINASFLGEIIKDNTEKYVYIGLSHNKGQDSDMLLVANSEKCYVIMPIAPGSTPTPYIPWQKNEESEE